MITLIDFLLKPFIGHNTNKTINNLNMMTLLFTFTQINKEINYKDLSPLGPRQCDTNSYLTNTNIIHSLTHITTIYKNNKL